MFLSEIKIIDLKRSKYTKTTAKPSKGIYKFAVGGKAYIDKPMADTTGGLDYGYAFKWGRNTEKDISTWNIRDGFEVVTVKDPYLPDGIPPNAEGRFVFGDAILMKITLRKYAEKHMKSQAKSDRAAAAKLKEFQTTLASKGVEASDEFIEGRKKELGID